MVDEAERASPRRLTRADQGCHKFDFRDNRKSNSMTKQF
jgi:hypothetical protein